MSNVMRRGPSKRPKALGGRLSKAPSLGSSSVLALVATLSASLLSACNCGNVESSINVKPGCETGNLSIPDSVIGDGVTAIAHDGQGTLAAIAGGKVILLTNKEEKYLYSGTLPADNFSAHSVQIDEVNIFVTGREVVNNVPVDSLQLRVYPRADFSQPVIFEYPDSTGVGFPTLAPTDMATNGTKIAFAESIVNQENPGIPNNAVHILSLDAAANTLGSVYTIEAADQTSFGQAITMRPDGMAVIGNPSVYNPSGETTDGEVYVYNDSTLFQKISAPVIPKDPQFLLSSQFGASEAMTNDGDVLAVGIDPLGGGYSNYPEPNATAGRVFIYQKEANGGYILKETVTNNLPGDNFGEHLQSDNGGHIFITDRTSSKDPVAGLYVYDVGSKSLDMVYKLPNGAIDAIALGDSSAFLMTSSDKNMGTGITRVCLSDILE